MADKDLTDPQYLEEAKYSYSGLVSPD
jgi:putative ABC transport system ATP-binding protein